MPSGKPKPPGWGASSRSLTPRWPPSRQRHATTPRPTRPRSARWRQEQAEQDGAGPGTRTDHRTRTRGRARDAARRPTTTWAAQKAAQTERVDAARKARAEASASLTPVTDAEVERYGREPGIQPGAGHRRGELRRGTRRTRRVGELVDRMPDRAAERRAGRNGPGGHRRAGGTRTPDLARALEASWQPGDAQGNYEAAPDWDPEPRDGDRLAGVRRRPPAQEHAGALRGSG